MSDPVKKFPILKSEPPSEEFMEILVNGGSPSAKCDFCERVHFDLSGEYMDEGELEGLLEKQKANPEAYIGLDGCVRYGSVDGNTFVQGCPCNAATRYEKFIWSHKDMILAYLNDRASRILDNTYPVVRKARNAIRMFRNSAEGFKKSRTPRAFDFKDE